jgi:hypothetical protein
MKSSTDNPEFPEGAETVGRTVVALFVDRSRAERAIRELKQAGFRNEQIGVATQDRVGAGADGPRSEELAPAAGEELAEGAGAGALTGGIIGGLVGLLSSLLIPGVGPLIVGGVLASTLMGMGVGAATGGLIGALVGMGLSEEDALYFDAGLREGRTLLTVSDTKREPEAVAILQRHGADLGPSRFRDAEPKVSYRGQERRAPSDAQYTGPERRLIGV